MPIYSYRCPICAGVEEFVLTITEYSISPPVPTCVHDSTPVHMTRVFSFTRPEPFEPHFNDSVGSYVTSMHDLKAQARMQSDLVTERTGKPHDFQVMDVNDMGPIGDAGLQSQHDGQVARGEKAPSSKSVF